MKISNLFKDRECNDIQDGLLKSEKRLLPLNELAKGRRKYILMMVIGLIMFLILNFCGNSIANLPNVLKGQDNILKFSNILRLDYLSWKIYIFFFVAISILEVLIYFKLKHSIEDQNVDQKGSARWTTEEEIKQQYKAIPLRDESFHGYGGLPVAEIDNTIYIDDTSVNTMLAGTTRSGKGETFVYRLLDIYSRAEKKASLVINDPKLELYPSAIETLESRGYSVYVLNLINPLNGMGYNPLKLIIEAYIKGQYSKAEILTNSFVATVFPMENNGENGRFWANSARNVFAALIISHIEDCYQLDKEDNANNEFNWKLAQEKFKQLPIDKQSVILDEFEKFISENKNTSTFELQFKILSKFECIPSIANYIWTDNNIKNVTIYSIVRAFNEMASHHIDEQTTALDVYFQSRPDNDRGKLKYISAKVAGERTKANIYSNMINDLVIFTYEEIAKMTSHNDLDLLSVGFGDNPIAIFMGVPDYDTSNHFISSIFLRQLIFINEKEASSHQSQTTKRKIVCLLDEFGIMPTIDQMDNNITVGLSRGIQFYLFVQSLNQIKVKYKDAADTIIENCGNQVYILSANKETRQYFSDEAGSKTGVDLTRNGHPYGLDKNITESYEAQPLIRENTLRTLTEGENLIIRYLKRRDLNGEKIRAHPILNTGRMAFKYRYEYLTDIFPSDKYIGNMQIGTNKKIDLEKHIYNPYLYQARLEAIEDAKSNGYQPEYDNQYHYQEYMFQYLLDVMSITDINSISRQIKNLWDIEVDKYSTINDIMMIIQDKRISNESAVDIETIFSKLCVSILTHSS